MKKLGVIVLCCFTLNLGISGSAAMAEDISEIHFVSEAWENVTHADGTGLCWELFRKVYEPRGIQVRFEIVPYARATNMVQQKQADASVGVYLDEYDHALFSEWHYLRDLVLAIFKKGKVTTWDGEKSLSGKIGWMRGYAFNEYLQMEVNFHEVDTRKSGLKMLERDRLDFFLDTETELREALQEGHIDVDAFQVETLLTLTVHLAFAENERGRQLRQIFDERMAELAASGELRPLYEKWKLPYPFEN